MPDEEPVYALNKRPKKPYPKNRRKAGKRIPPAHYQGEITRITEELPSQLAQWLRAKAKEIGKNRGEYMVDILLRYQAQIKKLERLHIKQG